MAHLKKIIYSNLQFGVFCSKPLHTRLFLSGACGPTSPCLWNQGPLAFALQQIVGGTNGPYRNRDKTEIFFFHRKLRRTNFLSVFCQQVFIHGHGKGSEDLKQLVKNQKSLFSLGSDKFRRKLKVAAKLRPKNKNLCLAGIKILFICLRPPVSSHIKKGTQPLTNIITE